MKTSGWTLEKLQTLFTYLTGSVKSDTQVARALSGWGSVEKGGFCPDEEAIPASDHEYVNIFAHLKLQFSLSFCEIIFLIFQIYYRLFNVV
jgi:hypothetical protein